MGKQQDAKWARRQQMQKKPAISPQSQEYQRGFAAGYKAQLEAKNELADQYNDLAGKYNDILFSHDVGASQVKAIDAMARVVAYAALQSQDAMGRAILKWIPHLNRAIREVQDKALKHETDLSAIGLDTFWAHVEKIAEAARRTVEVDSDDYDGGESLRVLSAEYDDAFPEIFAVMQREHQAAVDQAAENARRELERQRKADSAKGAEGRQGKRDQAIAELRSVRPERPDYSKPRLRDYYVAKCEALIEVDRFPAEKMEIYQHIKDAAESTLHTWDF